MYKDRTKEDRANWLKQTLLERGIPKHGMRKEIMERLDISASTVDRILAGQDPKATIGGRLSHQFDFLLSDYLWEDFVVEEALGPNRRQRIAEETKNLHDASSDAITEKTLRAFIKFLISSKSLESANEQGIEELQDHMIRAFFIFRECFQVGMTEETLFEVGSTFAKEDVA